MGKVLDGLVGVVHAEGDAGALEVVDLVGLGRAAVLGLEGHGELSGPGDQKVGGLVLVGVGVPAHHDGLGPGGDQPGNIFADDGLPEHGTSQDVTDGAIR